MTPKERELLIFIAQRVAVQADGISAKSQQQLLERAAEIEAEAKDARCKHGFLWGCTQCPQNDSTRSSAAGSADTRPQTRPTLKSPDRTGAEASEDTSARGAGCGTSGTEPLVYGPGDHYDGAEVVQVKHDGPGASPSDMERARKITAASVTEDLCERNILALIQQIRRETAEVCKSLAMAIAEQAETHGERNDALRVAREITRRFTEGK